MPKNKTILAVVIFAALLLVVLLTQEDPYERESGMTLPKLEKIDITTLDKVEITNKTESTVFEKRGDNWWITSPNEYMADKTFQNMVISKLEAFELDRLVSENKDKHGAFEVDEQGSRLKAYAGGKEIISLIVGKNTPDYKGTFIRLADSNAIYATKQIIGGALKKKVEDWRDKHLFDVKGDDVNKLDLKLDRDFSFTLSATPPVENKVEEAAGEVVIPKETLKWVMVGDPGFAVDENRIRTLTSSLSSLTWTKIYDEAEKGSDYGLADAKKSVAFTTKNGSGGKLILGGAVDKEEKEFYVKLDGKDAVYQIRKYQYEKFLKELSFYKGDATPPQ